MIGPLLSFFFQAKHIFFPEFQGHAQSNFLPETSKSVFVVTLYKKKSNMTEHIHKHN